MFTEEEIRHLVEEVKETYDEWNKRHFNRVNFGMEIMDVIHVAETLLRMHFSDQEIEEIQMKVLEKNYKRGYYEDEDYHNVRRRIVNESLAETLKSASNNLSNLDDVLTSRPSKKRRNTNE